MTGETRSGDEGCNRVADSAALAVGEDSSQHFFLSKRLFEGSLCIRLTCKVGMCISFPYIGFLIHVSCIGICAHGHAIPHGDLHVPAMPTARTAAHQMPQRPNADRRMETLSRAVQQVRQIAAARMDTAIRCPAMRRGCRVCIQRALVDTHGFVTPDAHITARR